MCGAKRLNLFFRLHEAREVLNKYMMWVWSDNFTSAFFTVCRKKSFLSKESDTKILQSVYFAYDVGISSYSNSFVCSIVTVFVPDIEGIQNREL